MDGSAIARTRYTRGMPDVAPATIAIYSDIGCPWAHLAVYRLHVTRKRLGLEDAVAFDHRAFPLEVFNERAGWQIWQAEPFTWPVTTLLALEAVQAAKEQGPQASERLDRALRVVLFGRSRCISLRHVVLEVAAETGIDVPALREALDDGRA